MGNRNDMLGVFVFVTLASGRTHPEYPAWDERHFQQDLVVDMFDKYFDAGLDLIERVSFSITGEKEMTLARQ